MPKCDKDAQINTNIHTRIHTNKQPQKNTYIHTYIQTYIPTYTHMHIQTYTYKYKQICTHEYIHACIHTPLSDKVEGINGAEEWSKRSVIRENQFTNFDTALRLHYMGVATHT